MSQLGYAMVALKVGSNSIKIVPQKGEMILSYEQALLANEYNASAARIGYYKRIPGKKIDMMYSRWTNVNENSTIASDDLCIED